MKDRPSTSSAGAEGGLGLVAGCDEGEGQELATGLVTEWQWGSWKGTIGNWSSCGSEGWPPRPPHTVSFLLSPSMAFLSTEHSMPPQRRTGEGDLPPSTRIQRAETCVYITFSPTLQDQSAFSSSGIMADFTVQYDVVMEDIIGDVQVPGPGTCRVLW